MIKTSIADIGSTLTGVVNIGCIGSAMTHILPNLIDQMNVQFPKVKTNIIETTTTDLLNQLQDGQIDILIGRPHKEHPSIHSERIYSDTTVLVCASKSKWNLSKSTKISELKDIPFIIYPRSAGSYFRDQLVSICGKHDFHPRIKHESINAYSILKLVEKDIGISVIPKSIKEGYNLAVNYFELKELNIPLEMVMSYRTGIDNELPKTIAQLVRDQTKSVIGY